MSKITNENIHQNQAQLKKINKKLKNEIKSRQKELEKVQDYYAVRTEDQRTQNNIKLNDLKSVNSQELAAELERKNAKLDEIKGNLEAHRKILDNEKEILQNVHTERMQDIRNNQENQLQNTLMKAFDKQRELTDKVYNDTANLNLESDNIIQNHTLKMQNKIERNADEQDLKLRKQQQIFEINNATKDQEFRRLQTQQELEHRNGMEDLLKKQQVEQIARENIYKGQMTRMKSHHSQMMKQTDQSYKIALTNLIKNHQSAIDTMKTNFKKHMTNLKNELSQKKEAFLNKSQDDFYQISKIEPNWTRDKDFYYFSLEIPEHEKEFVKLQAYDRDVKISLSRNFSNSTQDASGASHKNARTEVLTQEFQIPDLVDGNQVTRNYTDNTLTFRVKIK